MKHVIASLCIVLVASLSFNVIKVKQTSHLKQDADMARRDIKRLHAERDSLNHIISMALDAMDAKDLEITKAHEEYQKAQIKAEKFRIKYESIHFRPIANDSLRDRAWAELYPTQ